MGGSLRAPMLAVVTSSQDCMAAVALAETKLKLRLGQDRGTGSWRVIRFSAEGKRLEDSVTGNLSEFETHLKPYELTILIKS